MGRVHLRVMKPRLRSQQVVLRPLDATGRRHARDWRRRLTTRRRNSPISLPLSCVPWRGQQQFYVPLRQVRFQLEQNLGVAGAVDLGQTTQVEDYALEVSRRSSVSTIAQHHSSPVPKNSALLAVPSREYLASPKRSRQARSDLAAVRDVREWIAFAAAVSCAG